MKNITFKLGVLSTQWIYFPSLQFGKELQNNQRHAYTGYNPDDREIKAIGVFFPS